MPFDPNKFLAEDFDPNAFLGGEPQPVYTGATVEAAPSDPASKLHQLAASIQGAASSSSPEDSKRRETEFRADPLAGSGDTGTNLASQSVRENITFQALQGATRLATGEAAPSFNAPSATFGGSGVKDLAAQSVGMIGDPVAIGLGMGVAKGLKYLRPFQAADDLAFAVQEARVASEYGKAGADAAFKSAVRAYTMNKIARYGIAGAAEFGAYGAASEATKQFAEQDLDLGSLVSRTLTDAGIGAVMGPVAGMAATKMFPRLDNVMGKAVEKIGNTPIVVKPGASGSLAVERQLEGKIDTLIQQRAQLQERLEGVQAKVNEKNAVIYGKQQESLNKKLSAVDERIQKLQSEKGTLPATRDAAASEASPLTQEARQIKEQLAKGTRALSEQEQAALLREREMLSGERAKLAERRAATEQGIKDAPGKDFSPKMQQASRIEAQIRELTEQRASIIARTDSEMSDKALAAYIRINRGIKKLEAEKEAIVKAASSKNSAQKLSQEAKGVAAKEQASARRLAEIEAQLASGEMRLTAKEQKALLARKEQLTTRIGETKKNAAGTFYKRTDDINRRVALLEEQRDMLLAQEPRQILDKRSPVLEQRLQEIDAQIGAIRQEKAATMKEFKTLLQEKEPVTYGDIYAKQQFVERAFKTAEKEINRLVEKGLIPEERRGILLAHALTELIEARGFALQSKSAIIQGLEKVMLPLDVMSRVDSKHGTMAGKVVLDAMTGSANKTHLVHDINMKFNKPLQALSKRGMSNEEITIALEKTVMHPDGTMSAPDLLLETHPELADLRMAMDEVHKLSGATDYRAGYVPYRQKFGDGLKMKRVNPDLIESPTFNEVRSSQQLIPGYHEMDAYELLRRYANEVATHVAFKDTLPQAFAEVQKLLAVRDGAAANYLARYVSRAMELGGTKEISEKFAEYAMKANKKDIDLMIANVENPNGILSDLHNLMSSAMYKALVVMKPATQILQFMQPELIGSAEVGFTYVNKAYTRIAKDKNFRDFVFSRQKFLGTVDASNLEEAGLRMIRNEYISKAEKIITLPAYPFQKTFELGERINRPTMFGAGYLKFEDALAQGEAGIKEALAHLTSAERGTVLHTLETKGEEAAKEMFGVIINYRTNLCYTMANKPEIFTQGIGKMIPFTTWTSNSISRIVQDVARGDAKALVRRIAIPVLGKSIFAALLGIDLNTNPYDPGALASGFQSPTIVPQVTQPVGVGLKTYHQTDSITKATKAGAAEALKYNPWGASFNMAKKKWGEGRSGAEAVGFKLDKESQWQRRALPKIFRDIARP